MPVVFIQRRNVGIQKSKIAVIYDNVIGDRQALFAGSLCGDHFGGQGVVYPVSLKQARMLRSHRYINDKDAV